jgi:aspartate carbamoyltransferase catalytic subunit
VSNFPSLREYAMRYGLDLERYKRIGKDVVIMHPGPINRGVEVTSQVADHANSIILDQVENGVAIRMAVLYLLAARIPRQGV